MIFFFHLIPWIFHDKVLERSRCLYPGRQGLGAPSARGVDLLPFSLTRQLTQSLRPPAHAFILLLVPPSLSVWSFNHLYVRLSVRQSVLLFHVWQICLFIQSSVNLSPASQSICQWVTNFNYHSFSLFFHTLVSLFLTLYSEQGITMYLSFLLNDLWF